MIFSQQPKKKLSNHKTKFSRGEKNGTIFKWKKQKKTSKIARTSKVKKCIRISGRRYKNLLKKKEKKFISNLTKVLRKSKTKDPSKYWFLLKGPKKTSVLKFHRKILRLFSKT